MSELPKNQSLTLVFTDSRGKCLDAYLDHDNIKVKFFKGAGILQLVDLADQYICSFKPTCVLFIGGICDMTYKDTTAQDVKLRFTSYYPLLNHLSEKFSTARSLVSTRYPSLKVAFGGLCGMDLNRYNGLLGRSYYQSVIDMVIVAINLQIEEDNIANRLIHPTLTRKIHKRSRKQGIRNQYRLLYDGLHLSPIINEEWARNIIRFHDNNHLGNGKP